MSRNTLIAVVVVLLLVVGGWYLMRPKTASVVPPAAYTTPTEAPVASSSAAPSASGAAVMSKVREVKVVAADYAFSPSSFSVKKGEKVKIVLQNNGQFPHNLVIDELGVTTKTINAGQTDTVEFTASKSGSFTMYCSVDSHRQKGMEGAVSVQ